MTNLNSVLKSRDITLPAKVRIVKAIYCHLALYAEYIIRNARLDEAQAGIKIAGRNNHHRCAADTTLLAESKEELKSLLMKVKDES